VRYTVSLSYNDRGCKRTMFLLVRVCIGEGDLACCGAHEGEAVEDVCKLAWDNIGWFCMVGPLSLKLKEESQGEHTEIPAIDVPVPKVSGAARQS
jgi:hypothetical protein